MHSTSQHTHPRGGLLTLYVHRHTSTFAVIGIIDHCEQRVHLVRAILRASAVTIYGVAGVKVLSQVTIMSDFVTKPLLFLGYQDEGGVSLQLDGL